LHPDPLPFPTRRSSDLTNHWSWASHHPGLDIPRLETSTAITLLLVRDYLLPLLPKSIGNELAPYFEKAKEVLKGTKLEQWGRRVDRKSTRLNSSHVKIS